MTLHPSNSCAKAERDGEKYQEEDVQVVTDCAQKTERQVKDK